MSADLDKHFPRYKEFDPKVPVWCLTPELDGCIHRFFDTSPISPSGRYVALTQLPFQDRYPKPGEAAKIIIVDLETGKHQAVAETKGWDTQLGAQAQWGTSDHELFFNDVDTKSWRPFGVKMDFLSGARTRLEGTVYMVSPDGRLAASPCLLRTVRTQLGYGVVAPREKVPLNKFASADDGLYLTDTKTGTYRLLISFRDILRSARPGLNPTNFDQGDFYGFHVKWNPQATRLMFVVRWKPQGGGPYLPMITTMKPDGTDITVAMPHTIWAVRGGHHPDWCPDGEHILMNLNDEKKKLRFVKFKYDGMGLQDLTTACLGSGHPTMYLDGRHVLTDAYLREPMSYAGRVPIRWVDTHTGKDETLVLIHSKPAQNTADNALRVDPHPAWGPDFKRIVFNGCQDGLRKVYLADLSGVLPKKEEGN